mgnify:FL=1
MDKAEIEKLKDIGRRILQEEFSRKLRSSMDDECARKLLNSKDGSGKTFVDSAIEDFLETSDFKENARWNNDDIRLSIGRVLRERFEI